MRLKLIQFLSVFLMLCCLASCNVYQNKDTTVTEKWIPLFNGKDLEGCTININRHPLKKDYTNKFRVTNICALQSYSD